MTHAQIQTFIDGRTTGGNNPISTERALWEIFKNHLFIGQVIWVKMDVADIPTYFVTTGPTAGLGKSDNIYSGYAMPNGNNGTTDDSGLVSVAHGTGYISGDTGGEATHVLTIEELPENIITVHKFTVGETAGGGGGAQPWSSDEVNFGGNNVAHNNMQPYVVEVKLVRIA